MTQVVAWGAMLALSGNATGVRPTVVVWLKTFHRDILCGVRCLVSRNFDASLQVPPSTPLSPPPPLPLHPKEHTEFWACADCGRCFWQGPQFFRAVEAMTAATRGHHAAEGPGGQDGAGAGAYVHAMT